MFRKVNLKEENKDKLILYKNSREEYCEIPQEYIDNISYKYLEPSVISLTIPNKTTHNGETIPNHIFDKILGKRQQLKLNNSEMYIITDCERRDIGKDKKVKTVTAKSLDFSIDETPFYVGTGGITRHLYRKDGDIEISDGILDLFVKDNLGWSIGYVDDDARKEFNKTSIEYERNIENISKNNVTKEMILWEKSFTDVSPIDNNNILNVRISYKNFKSYDKVTGKLLKTESKVTEIGKLHTSISKIKATYTSTDDYRYCVRYDILLSDNTSVVRYCDFLDIVGYNISCDSLRLLFTNGTTDIIECFKYRSFEENTYKWLDFLRNGVQEAFDCIFTFDTLNKVVNCYAKKNYGENKGVYLSYDNFIKSINKKYQYDSIITKLNVSSENEGVSIVNENPTGQEYICDFSYFINNEIMSKSCADAWIKYNLRIEGVQNSLYDLRSELNIKNKQKIKLETEMTSLGEEIKGLEVIRNGYIKERDEVNTARLAKEINQKQDRVKSILLEISNCKDEIENIKKSIKTITDSIDINNAVDESGNKIFTKEDLEEIHSLTISDNYSDKYYLTNYGLYENSKIILEERNKLQIDFTVDTTGLLQNLIIPKGLKWDYFISIGDFINIDDDEIKGNIRIVGFDYSPKEFKITNISFTNKDKEVDDLKGIGNIGRTISRVDNYTNNYKTTWEKGVGVNDYINTVLTEGMDLRAAAIRSRASRIKTSIEESGVYIIDAMPDGNENNQICLTSSMICTTTDRWEHCDTAIDSTGVYAEQLIGRILMSNKLYIANENNSLIINEDGITIEANSLKIKGIDGTDTTFESYFEMVNNQIALGVKSSKDYTDTKIEITDKKIAQKVSNSDFNTYKEQTATTISQKVGKGNDFATEFSQNAEGFNFNLGKNGMNVNMNKDFLSVNGGGIRINNQHGETIIDGSTKIHHIIADYTVDIDAGNQNTYIYRIRHGLGYVPVYNAWQVDSRSIVGTSNTMLPALTISSSTSEGLTIGAAIRGNADINDVIITYTRSELSITSNIKVKVVVYVERLL